MAAPDSPERERDSPGALATLAFGLVSLAVLATQIVVSRFFAGTLTYYYAFMLISLAMLGLGAGGLAVRLLPRFFRPERVWHQAAALSLATAVAAFAAPLVALVLYPSLTFRGGIQLFTRDYWVLGGVFLAFFPLFLGAGTVVSLVLAHARRDFHRLYAVDLGFAALGCVLAVVLLGGATPTQAMLGVVAVLPAAAAALFALRAGARRLALVALATAALIAAAGAGLGRVRSIAKPPHLGWLGKPEALSEWNASSAIRAYPIPFMTWSLSATYDGPTFPMLDLLIDGIGGTQIVGFDGRAESLADYRYLDHDLPALGQRLVRPEGRQLVIGPGGGVDLLQAVRFGRTDVTAVEINPLIVRIVEEDVAAFSGRPYSLPGVRTFVENGRTFIKRSDERWDLVSLTWVDTGGSATALAFSENYLYTVEAYRELWRHLTSDGVLSFMRAYGVYEKLRVDTLRGIAVAMEAMRREGVAQPERHLLIAASQSPFFPRILCAVFLKRSPFTGDEVSLARRYLDDERFHAIWLPDGSAAVAALPPIYRERATLIRELLTTRDPERLYAEAPYDLQPATDDNPFYFVERAGRNRAAGVGVKDLGSYLAILATLVVPFLVLPLVPTWRGAGPLGLAEVAALAYFAILGVAFMLIEIELFHLFALLLGSPTLTLGTVLSSLLVFGGLGSAQAERLAKGGDGARLAVFAALSAVLLLFVVSGHGLLDRLVHLPLAGRLLATVLLVAPMAAAMGLPLPLGMRLVRERRDLVLWGWAINGAFAVLASVGAIYLAIHRGIRASFLAGLLAYVAAGLLAQLVARRGIRT